MSMFMFNFALGNGGIGDILKFSTFAYKLASDKNIKMIMYNHSPLSKYMFYTKGENINSIDELNTLFPDYVLLDLGNIDDIHNMELTQKKIYNIYPHNLYCKDYIIYQNVDMVSSIWDFKKELKDFCINLNIKPVRGIGIHLRLGDYYLETDKNFVLAKNDNRIGNLSNEDIENRIKAICDLYPNRDIFICCDNLTYKNKLISKFPRMISSNLSVGHTSLSNTTSDEIFHALCEFYMLSHFCDEVYSLTPSGFSIMANIWVKNKRN